MNPEKLLMLVQDAIDNRQSNQVGPWRICYLDGKIQCISKHCIRNPEIVFIVITDDQAKYALENQQWELLLTRIARFWSQKKL